MKKMILILLALIWYIGAKGQNIVYSDYEKPNFIVDTEIKELTEDDLNDFIKLYHIKCRRKIIYGIHADTVIPQIICFSENGDPIGIIHKVFQKKEGVTTTICRDHSELVVRKIKPGENVKVQYTDQQDKHNKYVNNYSFWFEAINPSYPCFGFGIIGNKNDFEIKYSENYVRGLETIYFENYSKYH